MCTIYFTDVGTFDGDVSPPTVKDEQDMDMDTGYPKAPHLYRPGLRRKLNEEPQADLHLDPYPHHTKLEEVTHRHQMSQHM